MRNGGALLCFMLAEHLHSGPSPRARSRCFSRRLCWRTRLRCSAAPRGSGTEALRIVVISQLSGAVSAQRLNKALKINHSSFLGANSHSKLLQSSQSIYRRHGLHTHLSVSCDSNTRERKVGEGRERTPIAAVAVTWLSDNDLNPRSPLSKVEWESIFTTFVRKNTLFSKSQNVLWCSERIKLFAQPSLKSKHIKYGVG